MGKYYDLNGKVIFYRLCKDMAIATHLVHHT